VLLFAELVAATNLPVVAIGGISADNCAPLFAAGAKGIAVVSAICGQDDPAGATVRLREKIQFME
jgi:thiamine-phosphate pyrophosphorylase